MTSFTPQGFARTWKDTTLSERQSYQIHFMDVCRLIGHETPGGTGIDSAGKIFAFEYGLKKDSGGQGFADVFYDGHFAIEYKGAGKYRDLKEAYQQLLQYREKLNNPPLLVVCDIQNWEIHTNWPNTEKKVYSFSNADIANRPSVQKLLHDLFNDPARLHPDRNTAQVTTDAADVFRVIAEDMRREGENAPHPKSLSIDGEGLEEKAMGSLAERTAHFLTKLVFCLFAEDVSLLPAGPGGNKGIFAEIVERTYREPGRFTRYAEELFRAMADGGEVLFQKIPYFNGSLFDDVKVEPISPEALGKLASAVGLNWESVEPAIFGTLFERSLDPNKRAQLGAHYTSREDILLIVEPVLMQPLRREWGAIQAEAGPIRAKLEGAQTPRERTGQMNLLQGLRERMLKRLREIKVLDPACGSGNFLYVSLQLLMDLEKEVINHDLFSGLTLAMPEVHPRQMYGIEINPIAHDLASIVVWIGYIQWRQNNGYATLTHREPILEALKDNIRLMDAIMERSAISGQPSEKDLTQRRGETETQRGEQVSEPEWPEVDVIVGNPPFLGGKRMRGELGDRYVDNLFRLYEGRVPPEADLVCYWYEKARAHLAAGKAKRAGLLATNSIRGGANREVLKRIKETGDIFMAWSDREWVLDGAAVRVSMVGFGANPLPPAPSPLRKEGEQEEEEDAPALSRGEQTMLDGKPVSSINADLTANVDITIANRLEENLSLAFMGFTPAGPFDLSGDEARKMLSSLNRGGHSNSDVVKPYYNAIDLTRRPRDVWTIDFGVNMSDADAANYEAPFEYIENKVRPIRMESRQPEREKAIWWIYTRPRPEMRAALQPLARYIATPAVAKHRIFTWLDRHILSDHAIIAIAREDDYFFGVLHSRLHEVWSLRMGTWLGKGNDPRYTPTTTFETFPFPWKPGEEAVGSAAYQAVAEAARRLDEERAAWLSPHPPAPSPSWRGGESNAHPPAREGEKTVSERELRERTLTNLYNALNVWRGSPTPQAGRGARRGRVVKAAGDFAPRLADLHDTLDKAVCAAYGWPESVLGDEEEILGRLLELNLARG